MPLKRAFPPIVVMLALALALAALACQPAEPTVREVPVTQIVTQEVEVEKIVTQEVEVVKEVPVTQVVTKEVEVEVPVEVEVEVMMEPLPPLVIGNLNAFTGSLTEFGRPLRNSVELAANHVNRAGGIQGASAIVNSRPNTPNTVSYTHLTLPTKA